MPQITCLCGQVVAADDAQALAEAYTKHNAELHPDIPISDDRRRELEQAILRTGGWDGRKVQLGPVEVKPLIPELEREYLEYFDGPALADNPVWARCYCLSYHLDLPPREQEERPSEQNRADRAEQIRRGDASGVLAFSDGRVIGWCNASPRTALPHLDRRPEFACDDPEHTGAIVCYVIAPQYRGQGLARKLLDGACEVLRELGMHSVDAYPPKNASTDAGSYHGRLSMYLDAGFEQVREAGRYVVVSKKL
jgi:ribosomal protein S18 acetylase RimI-like enzyme